MRALLAALLCVLSVPAWAARSVQVDQFTNDRYRMVVAQDASARSVTQSMQCPAPLNRRCRVIERKKKWKHRTPRHERVEMERPPVAVIIPLPRVRPDDAPEPDEDAATHNAVWNRIAVSLNTLEAPRVLRSAPLNIFEGFVREIERALPSRGRSLAGVVPPLAAKAQQLVSVCGSRIVSAVRNTRVAGSGRISLHASGRAVDIVGNPSCMYALLRGWPGGVSVDYARVRHIHISYSPKGREWGARFAHYRGGVKRTRYARYHKRRYASR